MCCKNVLLVSKDVQKEAIDGLYFLALATLVAVFSR